MPVTNEEEEEEEEEHKNIKKRRLEMSAGLQVFKRALISKRPVCRFSKNKDFLTIYT